VGDLVGQRLGLGVWRHAKLALQDLGAGAVLAQCFRTAAGARIGADQRPLANFRQRIERRQAPSGSYCRLMLARLVLQRRQPLQDAANEVQRTVSFAGEPFLERLRVDDEIGQKFTAVKLGRNRQLGAVL
jgi:hypothetical protein